MNAHRVLVGCCSLHLDVLLQFFAVSSLCNSQMDVILVILLLLFSSSPSVGPKCYQNCTLFLLHVFVELYSIDSSKRNCSSNLINCIWSGWWLQLNRTPQSSIHARAARLVCSKEVEKRSQQHILRRPLPFHSLKSSVTLFKVKPNNSSTSSVLTQLSTTQNRSRKKKKKF